MLSDEPWPKMTSAFAAMEHDVLGVDSNILIRFLTRDDEEQFAAASQFLEQAADRSLFVSLIVLVEINWVLRRVYKRAKLDVLQTLDELTDARQLVVEERARVIRAIDLARTTRADFSDALIALGHEAGGCRRTATFDVDALDLEQMIAVGEAYA
jgi:predicted nucleic-acid-binding protein